MACQKHLEFLIKKARERERESERERWPKAEELSFAMQNSSSPFRLVSLAGIQTVPPKTPFRAMCSVMHHLSSSCITFLDVIVAVSSAGLMRENMRENLPS